VQRATAQSNRNWSQLWCAWLKPLRSFCKPAGLTLRVSLCFCSCEEFIYRKIFCTDEGTVPSGSLAKISYRVVGVSFSSQFICEHPRAKSSQATNHKCFILHRAKSDCTVNTEILHGYGVAEALLHFQRLPQEQTNLKPAGLAVCYYISERLNEGTPFYA
jgi:hypothetical protein